MKSALFLKKDWPVIYVRGIDFQSEEDLIIIYDQDMTEGNY